MSQSLQLILNTLADLAVRYLQLYWQREDIRQVAQLEIYNRFLEVQTNAEKWKNRAMESPLLARLLVRPNASSIEQVDASSLTDLGGGTKKD